MYRFIIKLLFCMLALTSTLVFSAPIEIVLSPSKPVVLTNTNKKVLSLLCEIHAVVSANNFISIQFLAGKGTFNGTTLKQGDSLVSTLTNLQQIPISAAPGAKAQVTNMGTQSIKATCI
ncbi:hypothetical protein OQJ18_14370 [Fluoribacter dumoffii]|uniref:Uncharacterized protein n=1 Tax=Fluoribacter dumoffii TaxID=463 RepID=A0A377GDB6_9GAMM|nr:hypothetical protein [Fluoribacter dumoffii]KTC91106.1 hypothetical protein Ldum_2174 [Fluoribacter dumoffii NY 23]MCW8387726.1 hypothetical protein [Fluoribacter dumoffii]MCW8416715.1 hypothetical protein [Fluoribacter dumoffii]MCW8455445.1 hypothetical protein [Fluoribacter dumoffii]MCW8460477.1 hypothetical protein [Fluoribacter dumoffii]